MCSLWSSTGVTWFSSRLGLPRNCSGRHWLNKRMGAGVMWSVWVCCELVWFCWPFLLSEQMGSIRTVWLLILRFYTKHEAGLFRSEVLADKTSAGFALQNLLMNVHCFFCRSFCISCHLLLRVDLLCKICHSEALILRKGYKILLSSLLSPRSGGRLFERAHESHWEWRWVELRSICDNTLVVVVWLVFLPSNFVPLIVCLGNFGLWYLCQNNPKPFHALQAGLLKRVSHESPLEPCFCSRWLITSVS